jgi:hypothetical protein
MGLEAFTLLLHRTEQQPGPAGPLFLQLELVQAAQMLGKKKCFKSLEYE